jgi:Cu(I)/Ag(I) efflux system membrane protein CusA/SilA
VIEGVKAKLDELKPACRPGVEIVTTYDRSGLIDRAVETSPASCSRSSSSSRSSARCSCGTLRSALVAILTLPLGILIAFIVMRCRGINANILSLGGIAIAIGAMVDAAVVMIENAHKHLEAGDTHGTVNPIAPRALALITDRRREVGPALFFSAC